MAIVFRSGNRLILQDATTDTILPNLLPSDTELILNDFESNILPALPPTLRTLEIRFPRGEKRDLQFPTLPESLVRFAIRNAALSESNLPPLPPRLLSLSLMGCEFTQIPPLPPTLQELTMSDNKIVKFPEQWPIPLYYLDLTHNQITDMTPLPRHLGLAFLQHNPIRVIPYITVTPAPELQFTEKNLDEPFRSMYVQSWSYRAQLLNEGKDEKLGDEDFKRRVNAYYDLQALGAITENMGFTRTTKANQSQYINRNVLTRVGSFLSGEKGTLKQQAQKLLRERNRQGGKRKTRKSKSKKAKARKQ